MKYILIGGSAVLWLASGVVVSSLAGCSPPPTFCGNGIVEGTEQCDNPGDPLCLPCCQLSSGTCVTDNECPSGEYCDQSSGSGVCNSCGPACAPFTSCGPTQVCTIGGVCGGIQCTVDSDCDILGPNLMCTGGRCLPSPACSAAPPATCSDGTCPPGETCVLNVVADMCGCQPLTCDTVPVGECDVTLCSDGTTCVIDAAGLCACAPPPPPACDVTSAADCATALCSDGTACVIDAAGLCACAPPPPPACDAVSAADCATALCSDGTACVIDAAGLCACAPPVACDVADPANCASATCPTGQSCILDMTTNSCRCNQPMACDVSDPANCGAGSCGVGTVCKIDAMTNRCACTVGTNSALRGGFVYGVAPNPNYSVVFSQPKVTAQHTLLFDVALGELETLSAVLTYPPEFGFNGFLALGAAHSQIGSLTFDMNFDGTPESSVPIRSLTDSIAYADLNLDGAYAAYLEPSIEHTGAHVITTILPNGGDGNAASITSPVSMRVGFVLKSGIFTNPDTPGTYMLSGGFTSVDPDTGGYDDSANSPPLTHSAGLQVEIVAATIPTVSEWGLMVLAIVILTLGTIVIGRRKTITTP